MHNDEVGTIRAATETDIDELSAVLARAFQRDPVMSWVLRGERARAYRLPRMFAMMLRGFPRMSAGTEVALRDGQIAAAAVWDPRDEAPLAGDGSRWRELRSVLAVFGYRLDAILRGGTLTRMLARHRPERPHWYLAQLGTEPTSEGQGLGSALLASRLRHCDNVGMPAYLESSAARNIGLYERFGFAVTTEFTLPNGPTLWPMWREPENS